MKPLTIDQRAALDARAAYLCACSVVARSFGLSVGDVMESRARGGRNWWRFWLTEDPDFMPKRSRRKARAMRPPNSAPVQTLTIYLAVIVFDVRQSELARVLSIRRQSVNDAVRSIEDRRDLPQFNSFLQSLENQLPHVARRVAA